ncbi:inner membrane transporter RhtA [Pseudomonas pohangensis]|uniref:Inner membrane transporter RhtA n=1 Tax=Pseudomonas pohangensis TaxID=364197 RepID=A0A1H2FGY2_9PSED|nr:threonine/homoserine exporter RhtA [Pseudomonas pohangensis]SDU06624.1 inner membrane transporter RhtA [Pseudomonas pohangensis]
MPGSKSLSIVILPIALLVIAMCSIQGGAALAKSLFPLVGAEGTTALRLSLAALILGLVMRPWRTRLNIAAWRALVAYGTALGGMNLMFYMSLKTVPLGIAVSLEFTGPLLLAILSSRRAIDFVWVVLAVCGLALLLPSQLTDAPLDPTGAALALGAGACWALYIIFGQKAGAAHGAQTVALGTLVAALIVFPIGVMQAGSSLFHWSLLPVALAVALLSSALPYSLEMVALARMPARTFSILMSLEPAIAALSGMLFLQEQLTGRHWLAIGAIILAALGTASTIRPRANPPQSC